jgi:branched-chain amino acid transport system substrate-binding protein
VTAAGGKVLGSAPHPMLAKADFSSLVRQARGSGAKVLGLCNFGDDFAATLKAERAASVVPSMQVAAMFLFADDVHDAGLALAQGALGSESFYWDLNERTRAFAKRIRSKAPNVPPTMATVGNYAATLHYLKAAADLGVAAAKADGAAVVARMKAMPTDDDCFGPGRIRADGRKIHPSYLFRVKTPEESKSEWDVYELVATTPGDQAFRLSEGGCPLVKG